MLYIALVWASAILFVKTEESTVPPLTIMAGRAIFAFLTMYVIALATRTKMTGLLNYMPKFIFLSLIGIVIVWAGLAFGQEYLSVGLASVLVTVTPLSTFILLVFILRMEPFKLSGVGGLLLGLVGLVLVIGLHRILAGGSTLLGVFYIGGAFILLAINGILIMKWLRDINPIITTMYLIMFGAIFLTALAFIFESPEQVPWTRDTILSELVLAIICTASSYFGYFYLIKSAGAFFASFIFYFLPIFGLLEGRIFRAEPITILQVVGVALVFLGIYIINREKFKKG
ncbi:MAG: DMT family transporter [Thermodesulfobacteriota bacterium]